MVDIYVTLQSTLRSISGYAVYNERNIKGDILLPAISWSVNSMSNNMVGDATVLDDAQVTIKVWASKLENTVTAMKAVDATLRPLGYRRSGSNNYTTPDGICVGVLNYSIRVEENL